MLGRRHHLLQDTIGLQANAKLMLKRLEVNVAGSIANRQQENQSEQLAHWCAVG